MGTVYRGTRLGLDRPVAVKFLLADLVHRHDFVARFEREALAMSRLSHPHCVPVIDYGVADAPYLILEYVAGESLGAVIARGPLPVPRALAILRQILSALAHAHAQGVIHRDIKPDNIVLAEIEGAGDHARLLDFGLAKLSETPAASWSTASVAVGTPSYMSPEQARGEPVDQRTDLYSCGVVLFEMLTGRRPFIADNPLDVLKMHIEEPPPRLVDAAADRRFTPELEAFVAGFLAKDPHLRYASARAATEALTAVERRPGFADAPLVIEATRPRRDEAAERVPTPSPPAEPPPRRSAWPILVGIGSLAAAVLVAIVWLDRGGTRRSGDALPVDAAPSPLPAAVLPDARATLPADAAPPIPSPVDASPAPPDAARDAAPPPDPIDAPPSAPPDAAAPPDAGRDAAPGP